MKQPISAEQAEAEVGIVLTVVAGVIAEMAGVLGPMLGTSRPYDGRSARATRAFAFGLLACLLGLGLRPGTWRSLAFSSSSIRTFSFRK
jgi:CDP-diacylglycerol--glycerol-3-phosphate 3-phosphatidyltransferase